MVVISPLPIRNGVVVDNDESFSAFCTLYGGICGSLRAVSFVLRTLRSVSNRLHFLRERFFYLRVNDAGLVRVYAVHG